MDIAPRRRSRGQGKSFREFPEREDPMRNFVISLWVGLTISAGWLLKLPALATARR
jgi:hypothetical protein